MSDPRPRQIVITSRGMVLAVTVMVVASLVASMIALRVVSISRDDARFDAIDARRAADRAAEEVADLRAQQTCRGDLAARLDVATANAIGAGLAVVLADAKGEDPMVFMPELEQRQEELVEARNVRSITGPLCPYGGED